MGSPTPRDDVDGFTLHLTESEAWLLDEVVRHTFADEGQPVGKDLLLKVFSVLREFRGATGRPFPPKEIPITLTEPECWLIDYYVNVARLQRADGHTAQTARGLLLKVFDMILAFQAGRVLAEGGLHTVLADDALDERLRERLEEWQRGQRRREERGG